MKKKVFGLLALVCAFVCSLFIVGCGEEPAPGPGPDEATEYTVTFKNGDETVKTVTVEEGEALVATDIPADAEETGKFFDGWFVNGTQVTVGYTPTADVTATAQFTQGVVVTFKNGTETVKTVCVRPNTAVAVDDIPECPAMADDGMFFDGWFVGNVNVNNTYLVTEDVTATAQFTQGVAVTFKNGTETVKTVYVRPNATIAESEIPEDPTAETNFTFDAWVDGENNVVDLTEASFEEDTEIFASFTRTAYTVTFVNGTDNTPVTVTRGQDGFFLAAGDIPAAPAMESGHVFLGWYNGSVKAVGNLEITADTTFTALDVCKADYVGTWVNDDTYAIIDESTFSAFGWSGVAYTFNAETGALTFTDGFGESMEKITLMLIGDTLTASHYYYDWDYEYDWVTVTEELTEAQPFAYAGTYTNQNGKELVIIDGGIVTKHSSLVYEGRMYQEGENWFIKYKTGKSASSFMTIPVTITADGYIVVAAESGSADTNGVFMKNLSEKDYVSGAFWNDDVTLRLYTCTLEDDTVVYVYRADTMYYLATVDGTVADGNEVTLTLTGAPVSTVALKFYSAGLTGTLKFYERTDEVGTYTCAGQPDLVFDGYGNLTVGTNAATAYCLTENGIAVVYDASYNFTGYKCDYTAKTYTIEAQDGTQATFVKYNGDYTMMFDGFGTVLQIKHSDSSVYHQGTYTVSESSDVTKVTIEGAKYDSRTYTLYETGVLWYSKSVAYIKEGADVVTAQDYVGSQEGKYYFEQEAIVINVEDKQITVNGTSKALTLCCDENGIYYTYSLSGTNTITLGTEADTIVITNGSTSKTYTAGEPVEEEPEEPAVADAFQGKWDGNNDFYFDGFGNGKYNGTTDFTYTVDGNTITTSGMHFEYTLTVKSEGVLTASYYDDDAMTDVTFDVTYVAPDAFFGTWTNDSSSENFYQYTFTFDGYGNVTISSGYSDASWYNGTATYTLNENVATFDCIDYSWTCTVSGNTLTVTSVDSDRYSGPGGTWTKQGGGDSLDPFASSWTCDDASGNFYQYTITFDGNGNVTLYSAKYDTTETATYTLNGNVATFYANWEDWTCTYNEADGTLTVQSFDSDGYTSVNATFTRVGGGTEPQLDAYAGTWAGNSTFTFDGQGNGLCNGSFAFTYTVSGDTITTSGGLYDWTFTKKSDTVLTVSYWDDDAYMDVSYDVTKQ